MSEAKQGKGLCPLDPHWGQRPQTRILGVWGGVWSHGEAASGQTPHPNPRMRVRGRRPQRGPGAAPLAFLALLASCASPDPRLYTLAAAAPAAAPAAAAPMIVELRSVTIPGTLDRPEIVRSAADYRVRLAQNDRWSEPLADMVQRVLTQDLASRLPSATVYSDAGPTAADPTRTLRIGITRFESDAAGTAILEAAVSLTATDPTIPPVTRTVHLTAPIAANTTAAYAAALSATLAQLADTITPLLPPPPTS